MSSVCHVFCLTDSGFTGYQQQRRQTVASYNGDHAYVFDITDEQLHLYLAASDA
jgi:hypothetical protein